MKPTESNWRSWVAKAENDLLCIRNNLAAEQVPWDVVCYHAQQAAEKMLKAFLASRGCAPRKTHDLIALLGECVERESELVSLSEACETLNVFSVDVRYPTDIYEPDEAEARKAHEAAEHLHGAVLRRLCPSEEA